MTVCQSNGKTALKMAVTNKHYTSVALVLGHPDIIPEQVRSPFDPRGG